MIGAALLALVAIVWCVMLLRDNLESEPVARVASAPQPTTSQSGGRSYSMPPPSLPSLRASAQSSVAEPADSVGAEPMPSFPPLNDLRIPCSDHLDDDFVTHITALRDAGVNKRALVEAIMGRLAAQMFGSQNSVKHEFGSAFDAQRTWVDTILGEGTLETWRNQRLTPPVPRDVGETLAPEFVAQIRALQRQGIDTRLLAGVIAHQVNFQIWAMTENIKQDAANGLIPAVTMQKQQRDMFRNRQSLTDQTIIEVLGESAFHRYDRGKVLLGYTCDQLSLLTEEQADQLYVIRKEWTDKNNEILRRHQLGEIDHDTRIAMHKEVNHTYQSKKLELLGPELNPKFP